MSRGRPASGADPDDALASAESCAWYSVRGWIPPPDGRTGILSAELREWMGIGG